MHIPTGNFPEEFWLQAYTLNHERVRSNPSSSQLCFRYHAWNPASKVPATIADEMAEELACTRKAHTMAHIFYAVKRFERNASHGGSARMQLVGDHWRRALTGDAGNGINVLTNATVNCSLAAHGWRLP